MLLTGKLALTATILAFWCVAVFIFVKREKWLDNYGWNQCLGDAAIVIMCALLLNWMWS